MATIYFTSNADSGSGTLRAAISSAEAGDVIMPDPNVFTSGPVVIVISSTLPTFPNNATLDGGDLGIVLDGQNQSMGASGAFRSSGTTLTVINVTLTGYKVNSNAPVMLNTTNGNYTYKRCKFVENTGVWYGCIYLLKGSMSLYDCLITGNVATGSNSTVGGIAIASGQTLNFVRSTLCGNRNGNVSGTSRLNNVNSFVGLTAPEIDGVTPEEIGFVNPPPSAAIPEADYTEGEWESWDFRLKPTSPYLTGAAYESGDVDLLGHARTGSWGCFDGSWLVVGVSGAETVAQDASVDWLEVASTGVLTLSGADRILTVNRGVFVASGAAIASSSRGYVVAPSASDCDSATLTNVVCCVAGAGASNFAATTAGFTWSAADSTKSVVLERQTNGAWQTVAQSAGASYSAALTEGASVRLFDGVNFLTATVDGGPVDPGVPSGAMYVLAAGMAIAQNPNFNVWGVRAWEVVKVQTQTVRPLQSVTLLARIEDAFVAGEYLLNSGENIDSVKYTCRKKTVRGYETSWLGVTGHVDASADESAVLDALHTSSAWTADAVGYTFALTPDTEDNPLFPEPGTYQIVVTIAPVDENPVVIYFDFNVADET